MQTYQRRSPVPHLRSGFTLVEMMVATGLVVLILLLFSQMFGTIVGTMTQQQGISKNDAKARIIENTIRSDLKKMTFRQPKKGDVKGIVPLVAGDVVDSNQRGYFYYSENDHLDQSDDLIQFTVDVTVTKRNSQVQKLFGRGTTLGLPDGNGTYTADPIGSPNQPELDDGIGGDGTLVSRAAEVSYFLRGGNLYRRVALLRDPRQAPFGSSAYGQQPTFRGLSGGFNYDLQYFDASDNVQGPVPLRSYPNYSIDIDPTAPTVVVNDVNNVQVGDFWNDFDLSAVRVPHPTAGTILHINGFNSLENSQGEGNRPLGIPSHRFGFSPPALPSGLPSLHAGRSREFNTWDTASAAYFFIGRFLHEETSSPAFIYPSADIITGTSVVRTDPNNNGANAAFADADGDHVLDTFVNGPRTGEDLLATNVESIDVKVWDPTYTESFEFPPGSGTFTNYDANGDGTILTSMGAFVDIGHNDAATISGVIVPAGMFSLRHNDNPQYGPTMNLPTPTNANTSFSIPNTELPGVTTPVTHAPRNWNRVFDTWHPSYTHNFDATFDTDLDGTFDGSNSNPPYRPLRYDSFQSVADGRRIAAWANAPDDPTYHPFGTMQPDGMTAWAAGNRMPGQVYFPSQSNGWIGFRVTRSGEAVANSNGDLGSPALYQEITGDSVINIATSNANEPEWSFTPGAVVVENGDTTTLADDVVWEAFDNRLGIELIQIQIRYRDPQSGLSRQVTIQHSFVE